MASIIGPSADTTQSTAVPLLLITTVDTLDPQVVRMVETVMVVAPSVATVDLLPITSTMLQMASPRIISSRHVNEPGSKIIFVCKYSPFSKLCVLVVLIYK